MNRYPDKRIGLKDRQRILELASQGLSVRQIAERVGISAPTTKKVLANGLRRCARCDKLTDREDLCRACALPVGAPFSDRLKAFRVAANVSQLALALTIGVHESRVRNWEKGRKQPTPGELTRVAETLGISVQELTGVE